MTYPVLGSATTALPSNLGDPLLNAWILAWDSQRLLDGLAGFWHAPIFFPHEHMLATSEHLLGIAILVAPLQWIAGNPVLTYNIAWLFSFVLAAAGMYLLSRSLTGRHDAAIVAALAFAFGQYRVAAQISHLQALFSGWMPIALWALHRYFGSGSRYALAGFAAAFIMQALSSVYFLYYLGIAVLMLVAFEIVRARPPVRRTAVDLAVTAAVIAVALAPIALVYYGVQQHHRFDQDIADNVAYSAHLDSYFRVWHGMRTWRFLPRETTAVRALFPGFVLLTLAIVGVVTARGGSISGSDPRTRTPVVAFYVALTLTALVLSLGPVPLAFGQPFLPWGPYAGLMAVLPGLDGLRIPARLGTVVMLGLAVLGSFGVARVLALVQRTSARAMLAVVLGGLILVEGYGGPVPVVPWDAEGRDADRRVYRWLADGPDGAVLNLPIMEDNRALRRRSGITLDLIYQYGTLLHGHPLINGGPERTPALTRFLAGRASPLREPALMPAVLDMLQTVGVRYVIVHEHDYVDPERAAAVIAQLAQSDGVEEHRRFGSTVGFRLGDGVRANSADVSRLTPIPASRLHIRASHGQGAISQLVDGNHDSRWRSGGRQSGEEWIEIRLFEPSNVRMVRLAMTDGSLSDYPRALKVESIGPAGEVRQLFVGDVLGELALGLIRAPSRPSIDMAFGDNWTSTIRLRQTGETRRFNWSIHEVSLWRPSKPGI